MTLATVELTSEKEHAFHLFTICLDVNKRREFYDVPFTHKVITAYGDSDINSDLLIEVPVLILQVSMTCV